MDPGTGVEGEANLGGLLRAGRFVEAEAVCRRILAGRPGHAETLNNLANILEELDRKAEAEVAYRQAIEARPDFAAAHYNLGLLLQAERRLEAAEAAYRDALAVRPDLVQAHNNRGAALRDLRRLDEALAAFEAAVRLRPDYADAQFNLAMCRLAMGDYARGWAQYEWRWRIRQAWAARPAPPQLPWLGREPVAGQTILLRAEQGLGDTLQFCRYAPLVADLGARVVLEVQPGLERLLARLAGVGQVVTQGGRWPAFDRHAPLMSLPLALGTELESVPAATPYLSADPEAAAQWGRRLAGPPGLRVGLVWAGASRPDQPIAAGVDRRRSLSLDALAPLAAVRGARFFSLQKGVAAGQLADAARRGWDGPAIADHTAALNDFADTAALVANLDLVISCDTSVAHLAGAMGKPVWILSRFDGCWRWLSGRDDSPWYPTARLFRQAAPGDWPEVVARVAAALAERVGAGQGGA
ncbi:MAG: tetratricopeptide repeat-containing glycosyltransferase family protein [Caulobacteraceae bacterium]|nr:tetratricopeptide repeat-containing glycosyltransferase family protein [Caulobacteraceae bacterium]